MTDIRAEVAGAVTAIHADVGSAVEPGDLLLTTEMMKMVSEVKSPCSGEVTGLFVTLGDLLEPGQLIAKITASSGRAASARDTFQPGHQPLIEELRRRRQALSDVGRGKRVARRHESGGRTARENIADLLDEGSFSETGGHVVAAQHSQFDRDALIERSAADGVITGTGTIEGVPVAVLVVDYSVMAGTQGFFHHRKVDRLIDLVRARSLPLIVYPEGGGGRPNDVDAQALSIAGLDLFTFRGLATLRGNIPVIALVHGFCFAGSAAFAGVADILIATRNASIGMGGPAMIEGGGLGRVRPEEVGPAAMHFEAGTIDFLVEDEAEGTALVRKMTGLFAGPALPVGPASGDELDRLMPRDRRVSFDMHEIIDKIFDEKTFVETKAGFAPNIITGFARLNGRAIAVLANDCRHLGGAIDGVGASKAADLIDLAIARGLPLVSLVDTPGFMVGVEAEKTGQIKPISRMFCAGANLAAPVLCVVVRRAFGLGAMAMAGGSLHAPDLTISWPSGVFGAMGLEGAVRLGQRDRLAAIEDDAERELEVARQVDQLYERGKAVNAAQFFEFDDVIEPNETRERLILGLIAVTQKD